MSTYEKTMERLRKLNAGRPVTEHTAVEMLSYEIESYRARVEDMRAEIQSLRTMSTKILTEDVVKKDIFAENIKRLLDEKCMSQRELADAVGVTEVAMSRYLNDGRMPKGPILHNITKVLGVSVGYLFEEHPEETADGSGATPRRTEAESIKDQLVRKGDVFNQITDIIAVPYMMPEKDLNNITEWMQRYISDLTSRIRALPPAGTAEPREDLRTCPFCGGTTRLVESAAEFNEDMAWCECNRCGARTRPHFGPSRVASAVSSWNQRPDPVARAEANEDIIRNLIEETESLRETIANLRKGSVSEDRVTEIAETAARNFKRAAMQGIKNLQTHIMRSQNPGDRFKFSGMSEALEAIREIPPDLEE